MKAWHGNKIKINEKYDEISFVCEKKCKGNFKTAIVHVGRLLKISFVV